MRKSFVLALSLMLLPAFSAQAEQYVYQGLPQMHATTPVSVELLEKIREKTNGEVDIKFTGMGSVVKPEATFNAVRDGILDMAQISPSDAITSLPYSNAVGFPWIVKNSEHGARLQKAFWEQIPEIRAEVDRNMRIMAMWSSDRNCILSTEGLIKSPADFAGKRVLTWTPALIDEIRAWGGIPVSVSSGDAYVGLQRGMGTVAYSQLPMVRSLKLFEVAKYATPIAPSGVLALTIGMNKDAWDSISPENQKIVDEVLADWSGALAAVTTADGDATIQIMKDSGCQVYELSPAETEAFRKLSMPVQRAYWVKMLANAGIKDAEAYIDKVNAIAATVE